jgi:outer membrane receptor protein involved in Fe transport
VNLAAYYYEVEGMQVGVNLPFAGGLPVLITLNAGNSTIKGLEADFAYRPDSVPGLELSGAANYNHARFTKFVGAPCPGGQTFAEGCNLLPAPVGTSFPTIAFTNPALFGGAPFRYTSSDLTGTRLARAPDFTAYIGANYEMPIANDMGLGFSADAQFTSKYLTGLGNRPDLFQSGFAKLNASITLRGKNEAWEVALIGNNITNKLNVNNTSSANYAGGVFFPGAISGGPARGPSGQDELLGYVDRGREIWIRVTLRPLAF